MKKREEPMPITVEPVKLKPFFGMEPPVYLTLLYVLIILVILFFIGFLPGILNSGKRVTFTSAVDPVVVIVDGNYIGSAPTTAFIPSGEHEAVFRYEGVGEVAVSFEVGHPVFFTWLFPRKQTVSSKPFLNDISAFRKYLLAQFDEIVAYSAIIEFTPTYHRPPLFLQTAHTARSLSITDMDMVYTDFLLQSLNHMTSQTMVDDYRQALTLITEEKVIAESTIETIEQQLYKIEGLFDTTKSNQMVGEQSQQESVSFERTALQLFESDISPITGFSYPDASFIMGKQVPAQYPGVQEMGIEVTTEPFSIGALEVSEYLWAHFIAANPYWSKNNIAQLMADNMVDENYLGGIYPTTAIVSTQPIRNISWHAAQAFTRWLGEISGKEVFLPSQAEWELAAMSVHSKGYQSGTLAMADRFGPSAMLGGYWEFTRDAYIPLQRFSGITPNWDTIKTDVVIKGGSSVNTATEVDRATVGVISRSTCSDTLGLRIAWKD